MSKTSTHLILIFSISALIFFTSLGGARLWDRDEPRNAGCAEEMLQRGDLIVPTFNAQLRHQKPVLLYWLMMSAYSVLGVSEFSARFWSAALGVGTVFLTYGIGIRWMNARVGLIAAIILATSVMFDVAARAATPDSLLIFCSTLAIWFYSVGIFKANQATDSLSNSPITNWFPTDFKYALGMYVAMSFGVLAKGPVGIVLPTAIIGMFLLIQRLPETENRATEPRTWFNRFACLLRPFHPVHFLKTCWAMRPITAIVCLTLIAAPWFVLVGLKTDGEFLRLFFVGEHFGRATTVLENHSGGPWYYPATILIGFFPWSVFWLPVTLGVWQSLRKKSDPVTIFLLCWIGVQVGLFTIAKTKLPSYVTPCYPALAILTSVYFDRWINSQVVTSKIWTRIATVSLALSGLVVITGFVVLDRGYLPGTMSLAVIGAIPLVGGILAFRYLQVDRKPMVLRTMCWTAVLFCFSIFPIATTVINEHRNANLVFDRIADTAGDQKVASFEMIESTWVYYGQHPIDETHEAASVLKSTRQREFWNQRPIQNFEQYAAENSNAVYVTTKDKLQRLKGLLCPDYVVVQEADYFLRNKKIVLLARSGSRLAKNQNGASNSSLR